MFTLFSLLPNELRFQIWKECLDSLEPRIIPIRADWVTGVNISVEDISWLPISIRAVCSESYRVCEQHLAKMQVQPSNPYARSCIFLNPGTDILYFKGDFYARQILKFAALYPKPTQFATKVAMEGFTIWLSSLWDLEVVEGLHDFESLRDLVIVTHNMNNLLDIWASPELRRDPASPGWILPEDVENGLANFKLKKWPDWKVPVVRAVVSEEEILGV